MFKDSQLYYGLVTYSDLIEEVQNGTLSAEEIFTSIDNLKELQGYLEDTISLLTNLDKHHSDLLSIIKSYS